MPYFEESLKKKNCIPEITQNPKKNTKNTKIARPHPATPPYGDTSGYGANPPPRA